MPMDTVTRIAFAGALFSLVLNGLWFVARYSADIAALMGNEVTQLLGIVPNATLAYFFYAVLKRQGGSPGASNSSVSS